MRAPGEIVGSRYEIVEPIASGGMGAVYRARHRVTQREVALKLMLPHVAGEPRAAARFRREASVAAEIGHPGIVEVIDAGVDPDGSLFLVMELLRGESLRARLARGDLTRGEALALVDALLDPLAAAHARGFVHRDLKPENVFVTDDGRVKLLDFGIARHAAHESATLTGTAIGTPHYMAPEQAMSAKGATPASDVWSVGVMMYEILCGRPPFVGPTPHAIVVRACVEPHAPPASLASEVGPRLAALIDAALAKDPRARPSDAQVLRAALRAALRDDPDASAAPVTMRSARPVAAMEDDGDAADEATLLASSRPPPSLRPSTGSGMDRSTWRTLEEPRYSIRLPPGWSARPSTVPGVAALFVEDATSSDPAPTQIRLKIEPFEGDTREYADLGITNLSRIAHVLRATDAELAGITAFEVEAEVHAIEPRVRHFSRGAVRGGIGYVAQCTAAPERWADVGPILRAILGTLRLPRDGT